MKIEGKFIFKVAGTLTAISLVVALLLGLTNMLTADKIAAINKQKTEEALAKVVSAADCEFPPMEEIPQAMIDAANEQGGKLSEVYEVQSGGDTIGYAFKVTASGSQGNIVMIVGVDTDLTVTGVSIVKASETAGIGSKVIDNEATSAGTGALDQFVGKSGAGTLVVKQNIDAVTGATVSTKGVTKGVNAALAAQRRSDLPKPRSGAGARYVLHHGHHHECCKRLWYGHLRSHHPDAFQHLYFPSAQDHPQRSAYRVLHRRHRGLRYDR